MRIAVCIPGYKPHARYIQECMDTLNHQTRKPDLISISLSSWDDPNPPNFQTEIPVRFQVTPQQACSASNRNIAAAAVADEVDILSFMDMDDYSCPTRLAEIEAAIQNGADAVVHSYRSVRRNSTLVDVKDWPVSQYPQIKNCFVTQTNRQHGYITIMPDAVPTDTPRQLHNGHISLRSECWKTMPYPYGYIRCEDSEYNYRLYNAGYKFVFLPNQLSLYREL